MIQFIMGLTGNVQPPQVFDPNTIVSKLDGWWVEGIDQLASNNLTVSGSQYALPNTAELKDSTKIISLNEWYLVGVPVLIEKSQISNYCASRQFYNTNTDELFIIKNGEHLTQAEEDGLISYLGISKIHSYHANSTALFSRFTNTYSHQEKSRLDNVMRLLVNAGIYNKLHHFYLAALSGIEEQFLNWIDPTKNMFIGSDAVTRIEYRGLAPQTGYFDTGATLESLNPDDCFFSYKSYDNFVHPNFSHIFDSGERNFYVAPRIIGAVPIVGYSLALFNSYPTYASKYEKKYSDSIVFTRSGNNVKYFSNGVKLNDVASTRNMTPTADTLKIGGVIADRSQSNPTTIQHLAWGDGLTEAQGVLMTNIIENFCYGQKATAAEYIDDGEIKITTFDYAIKDAIGSTCIYADNHYLYYSEDLTKTWKNRIAFDINDNGHIEMCHIFDNGKVILCTQKNKVFKTTIDLLTLTEITATKNGVAYPVHTPVNALYKGDYFRYYGIRNKQYLGDGREIIVWNNYGNVFNGANPTVCWYSFGDEIKVAFEFGQNPYNTDIGLFVPDIGGNLLGDANSNIRTRHGHGVTQRDDDKNRFYTSGGDYDRAAITAQGTNFPAFYEANWVELIYNPILDTWAASIVMEASANTKAKTTGLQFPGDGYGYYSSDATINDVVAQYNELGYFKTTYANFGTPANHVNIFKPANLAGSMTHFHIDTDGFLMAGGYAQGGTSYGDMAVPNIIYSADKENYTEKILKIAGNLEATKIIKLGHRKYLYNYMSSYSYYGTVSIVIEFK